MNLPAKLGGGGGFMKPSINPQDLKREIYVKGKAVSAGTGGVGESSKMNRT